jgi:pimeloyl-ACP methyl ester carboxylesterase
MIRAQLLPHWQEGWLSLLENVLPYARINPAVGFGEDDLGARPHPVLSIWGANDPFGSIDVGQRAQAATRGSKLDLIGQGHLPWLDEPEECGRAIQDFGAGAFSQ